MEANQFYFITFESIVFLSIQLDKKIDFFRLHKRTISSFQRSYPLLSWPMSAKRDHKIAAREVVSLAG